MSNSDSNKKQPTKKPNSYSLLLKGLNEVQKTKPSNKNSNSSKKPKDKLSSQSIGSPDSIMSLPNDDYRENPSSNDKTGGIQDPDVPDRSYGDYYCKLCDSHMNSDNMWEAHITGKRHMKNVKNGDTDSKYEDLPDVESSIKYELRNVKDPVVGLSYIHEIRRKEPNIPPIYNCFLCHASIATVPLVTEHVISMKHRLNYIKESNPEEYQLIEATNLKKGHMEPLVIEAARKMEQQVGRGTVKVKQEKKKAQVTTWGTNSQKRSFNVDSNFNDDRYQKPYPKNPNFEELGPCPDVWKSVDIGRSFRQRERSRSPRDFRDNFMSRSRSRSPRDFREKKRMFSADDYSMDGYKRSLSNRDYSPSREDYEKQRCFSKRDVSPKHDYRSIRSKTDDFLQSSRKSDSRDRLNYIASKYEQTPQESIRTSYSSLDHQKSSSSLLPQENYHPAATQLKSVQAVLGDTSSLSNEDCYNLFYLKLKSLPEISDIGEMLALTKLIGEAQKKLRSKLSDEFLNAVIEFPKSSNTSDTSFIPGLGDAMSSSAVPDESQKASNAASYINSILKSANLPHKMVTTQDRASLSFPMPTSYSPAINSQPPAVSNIYQPLPASYQAPPSANTFQGASANAYQGASANTYQGASTNSYPNQTLYQHPNMPFSQASSSNVPNLNYNEKATPRAQFYNYSHLSSTSISAGSKNYSSKY